MNDFLTTRPSPQSSRRQIYPRAHAEIAPNMPRSNKKGCEDKETSQHSVECLLSKVSRRKQMGELNWYSVSLGVVCHLLRMRWHLQIAEDR